MRIFISRDLDSDSVFWRKLAGKVNIIGHSLIDFQAIPFDKIPTTDWLFFYSKQGIKYCLSQLDILEDLPKIGLIGQASADYLVKEYGLKADFIGTGAPEETAQAFGAIAKNQKVVFAQAKQSKQSIQKLLEGQIEQEDLVVYDNVPKKGYTIPLVNILVFTSPLSVFSYFLQYPYNKIQKVVCIGQTTAQAVKDQGINDFVVATQASEEALAEACLLLL